MGEISRKGKEQKEIRLRNILHLCLAACSFPCKGQVNETMQHSSFTSSAFISHFISILSILLLLLTEHSKPGASLSLAGLLGCEPDPLMSTHGWSGGQMPCSSPALKVESQPLWGMMGNTHSLARVGGLLRLCFWTLQGAAVWTKTGHPRQKRGPKQVIPDRRGGQNRSF